MDFSDLYQVDHKKKKNKAVVFVRRFIFPVIGISIFTFLGQWGIRNLLIFPVKIETNSMTPLIPQMSSRFFIYSHLTRISRNDIIYARQGGIDLFCKIVGTEGEAVQILDKSLFVNHVEVKNYSEISGDKATFNETVSLRDNTPEYLIGPHQYFCLNENWENLQDSRLRGPIDLKSIKGKILFK